MFVKDSRYSGNGNSYCYSLPPLPPYLHFPNPSRYRYVQTCLAALHSRTTMIVQAQTIFHNGHSPSIPGSSSPSIARGIFWIDVVNSSAQFIPVHWLLFGLFLAPAPSPVAHYSISSRSPWPLQFHGSSLNMLFSFRHLPFPCAVFLAW